MKNSWKFEIVNSWSHGLNSSITIKGNLPASIPRAHVILQDNDVYGQWYVSEEFKKSKDISNPE